MNHVRTFVRFRPAPAAVTSPWVLDTDSGTVAASAAVDERRPHSFDGVFPPGATTRDVYDRTTRPLIPMLASGMSGCVMCYGQTGSGKTYTIFGDDSVAAGSGGPGVNPEGEEEIGIVEQAVREVFQHCEANRRTMRFRVAVSFFEVYNEMVVDLLAPDSNTLDVRETPLGKVFHCPGLSVCVCQTADAVLRWVSIGRSNRAVGCSHVHEKSSRSHAVLTLHLAAELRIDHAPSTVMSRLSLVDLAGSEALSFSYGAQQQTESKNINLSLFSLRRVITALADAGGGKKVDPTMPAARNAGSPDDGFVPYRNSVLTKMLASCLGQQTLTTLICTCSSVPEHAPQTLATLKFGDVAATVRVNAEIRTFLRQQRGARGCQQRAINESAVSVAAQADRAAASLKGGVAAGASAPVVRENMQLPSRQGPIAALRMWAGALLPLSAGHVALCLQGFGNGCGIEEFSNDLMPMVAASLPGVAVYAIDFPGFGRTSGRRQTSRTERLWENGGPMEVLVDVLDAITARDRSVKVALLGWDWGGNMALTLALSPAYRQRLSCLALTMPSWTSAVDDLIDIKTTPVLLNWAPTDQLHLYATGKRMARAIKQCKLVTLQSPAGRDVSYAAIALAAAAQSAEWLCTVVKRRATGLPPELPARSLVKVKGDGDIRDDDSDSDSGSDDGVCAAEVDDDDDDDSFSTQSSFLAVLLGDPIAAEDLLAAERRERALQKRRHASPSVFPPPTAAWLTKGGGGAATLGSSVATLSKLFFDMASGQPDAVTKVQFRDALLGRSAAPLGLRSQILGAVRVATHPTIHSRRVLRASRTLAARPARRRSLLSAVSTRTTRPCRARQRRGRLPFRVLWLRLEIRRRVQRFFASVGRQAPPDVQGKNRSQPSERRLVDGRVGRRRSADHRERQRASLPCTVARVLSDLVVLARLERPHELSFAADEDFHGHL